MEKYFAHGKLLLSAEYMVLHGSQALAVPLKRGQELHFYKDKKRSDKAQIYWRAYDWEGNIWLEANLDKSNFNILHSNDMIKAETLATLLNACPNPFWEDDVDYRFETHLQFDRSWGWGTSSTLVSLIAQCTGANPYQLYKLTFKGRGYDLACATAKGPILFSLVDNKPYVVDVQFNPSFKNDLFLIYLGKKQDSLKSIAQRSRPDNDQILRASELTQVMLNAKGPATFLQAIIEHEALLSNYLGESSINDTMFKPYSNVTAKSLGAWGGDFALVHCTDSAILTQLKRDFNPVFTWGEEIQSKA